MTRNTSTLLTVGAIALALVGVLFAHYGTAMKTPARPPAKPAYARVAVSRDGSKILNIILKESNGGGCYDEAYVDTNFDGRFSEDEKFTGNPAIASKSASTYCQMDSTIRESPFAGCPRESHLIILSVRVAEDRGRDTDRLDLILASGNAENDGWGYSAMAPIESAPDLRSARVIRLDETPKLAIDTEPGRAGAGSLGVDLDVTTAKGVSITARKGSHRPPATVKIVDAQGKAVTNKTATLDVFESG